MLDNDIFCEILGEDILKNDEYFMNIKDDK
jgi:hypothetical protein